MSAFKSLMGVGKKMSERCMAKKRLNLPFIYIPLILMNEISIKSQKRRRKKIKKNQIKKMMPPLLTRLTNICDRIFT